MSDISNSGKVRGELGYVRSWSEPNLNYMDLEVLEKVPSQTPWGAHISNNGKFKRRRGK